MSPSLDFTLIMGMLFMITSQRFFKWETLSKIRSGVTKITVMVLKIVLVFQTEKKINIPLTSLIWFPKHGLPETIRTSLYLMLNMNTTGTLFFSLLLLCEISSIIIFKIQNLLVLLKSKSLNLLNQVLMVHLMCIILMELNYLQDYELG